MSQVRDIELEVAYYTNDYINRIDTGLSESYLLSTVCYAVDEYFNHGVNLDHSEALMINSKYVVLARYDENQYSSPPNMRMFGIFSSIDKAKDTMAVWAINKGLGNEFLSTCEYEWVLIDGVNV